MTRLCLLSMGRAEGCAETLLLPGWGGRSAWSARAAPVPIPLVPTSIPNRAEGFTPALGQAGTPPSTLLSSSAARRPLSAGTAPTATGSTRVVVASAWAALRGQGCQQSRTGKGEVWGGLAAPRRHRCCWTGIQVVLPKGLGQSRLHREPYGGLAGQGPPGSTEVAFSISLCMSARSSLVQLVQEDRQGR